ncbi:conjugative transposon protein TraM [Bacteroidia bacterium]|nr:conjugative transposon protein TraM [Bacteroidia bacterium]GHT61548.1 conjugative transposon protein TraM [Bacteroidia bacterium]
MDLKINFKKPKYIIPAIALIPLLWLGWNIIGMLDFKVEENSVVQTEGEINTDMPEANLEKMDIKSKYKNMMDEFGRKKDYSAVQELDIEATQDKSGMVNSLYDEEEIARLDSLEKIKAENLATIKQLQEGLIDQQKNEAAETTNQQTAQTAELVKQMEMLQKLASGEEIKTPETIAAEEKKKQDEEKRKKENEEALAAAAPKDVLKADALNRIHFNTIGQSSQEPNFIHAMLDESLKVVDGSRIRIRLMDDVVIENMTLAKGTYLYAVITGFGKQRVKASITSILINDRYVKVSLNIFDNDGMEGFYVPESEFRELAKNTGSSALGQNINMNNNSGEQNLESFAVQTLQNVYQSTTSAISSSIKKNKAKLKYSTNVYLINSKNN